MKEQIIAQLIESADLKKRLATDGVEIIELAAKRLIRTLEMGGKILLCGNGGSAADAQHLAAELVCRLTRERKAIPAIAQPIRLFN